MTTPDNIESQVSALVDDELGKDASAFLSKRMARDPALQRQWQDYNLISDTIKKQLSTSVPTDFSSRVSQAISEEQSHSGSPLISKKRGRLAGFAVAASVSVMGVLAVLTVTQQGNHSSPVQLAEQASPQAPVQVAVLNSEQDKPSTAIIRDPRINKYLVDHSEYSVNASVNSVLPYARIVGRQEQR